MMKEKWNQSEKEFFTKNLSSISSLFLHDMEIDSRFRSTTFFHQDLHTNF